VQANPHEKKDSSLRGAVSPTLALAAFWCFWYTHDMVESGSNEQLEMLEHLLGAELSEQKTSNMRNTEQESKVEGGAGAYQAIRSTASSVVEVRPDLGREQRKGVPEIIFGETKDAAQIIVMAQGLLAGSGRAIISRLCPDSVAPVSAAFHEYKVRIHEVAHAMVIYRSDYVPVRTGGHVGVISAGTSDIPVAEEAALIAEEMGCQVTRIYDVGVAGLHRLFEPLRDLLTHAVDVIIVAAGMDGALPSVVAGFVPVPVIGLPTSIGYGLGGKGVAALLSMLQTCAPGLSVVNIDNGVGAGITAALIANRVARAREHQSQ
jgi:pyridinium-3,5-biscarboxylic acid mononucleotide synthase